MQDVIDLMRKDIEVETEAGSNGRPADAFHVRFTYTDPNLAARVTSRLGSLFADFNTRDRSNLADATDRFLESQLTEARARLTAQEKKVEEFRQKNAGRLPSEMAFNMQAIQNAQVQLQALIESLARDRDRKLMLERLYEDAQQRPEPVPAASSAQTAGQQPSPSQVPEVGSAKQQLEMARALLARLELRLTPEHPDVVRTRKLIKDLEEKVAADTGEGDGGAGAAVPLTPLEQQRRDRLSEMRAQIESLDRQIAFKTSEEQRLQGQIADYQKRIETIPGNESEWSALTRDYNTQQQAYNDLLKKSESARMAADLEQRQIGEQFRVLDPAQVPVTPIGPNRVRINAIGAVLGFALGLGLAALLEYRDTSFRSSADVLDVLALPVLALVPLVETEADRRRQHRRRLLVSTVVVLAGGAGAFVFWTMRLWKFVR